MANCIDLKLVLKHLANGNLGENLCRVCLEPLTEHCENIFTSICKEGKEYCIADVLKELCDIKISDNDHYNVCANCFTTASNAYKFYINARANEDLLHYYTDKLDQHIQEVPTDIVAESVCISLPEVLTDLFDYDIKDIRNKELVDLQNDHTQKKLSETSKLKKGKASKTDDDNIVIVMNEQGQPTFYKLQPDGQILLIDPKQTHLETLDAKIRAKGAKSKFIEKKQHKRKKRDPMAFKQCLRCPMKYRFLARLKEHVSTIHGSILYSCKICEAITEDEEEYNYHMKLHTAVYKCDKCNYTFRRRETILNHMKEHDKLRSDVDIESKSICQSCGAILDSEEALKQHTDLKHYKKYTCFYCGRMYRGEASLEKHLEKHERLQKKSKIQVKQEAKPGANSALTCEQCGRSFGGQRALMWHARLHSNERPFTCEVCGRGFVSANRRSQHALCAHTVPARRCPLCPALFHLRSMVNSHIKKVHLKKHKRRSRAVRQQDVFWHTEPVPIGELSLELQNDILELKAAQEEANRDYNML